MSYRAVIAGIVEYVEKAVNAEGVAGIGVSPGRFAGAAIGMLEADGLLEPVAVPAGEDACSESMKGAPETSDAADDWRL